jgi:hypothetical protein
MSLLTRVTKLSGNIAVAALVLENTAIYAR